MQKRFEYDVCGVEDDGRSSFVDDPRRYNPSEEARRYSVTGKREPYLSSTPHYERSAWKAQDSFLNQTQDYIRPRTRTNSNLNRRKEVIDFDPFKQDLPRNSRKVFFGAGEPEKQNYADTTVARKAGKENQSNNRGHIVVDQKQKNEDIDEQAILQKVQRIKKLNEQINQRLKRVMDQIL